MTLVLVMLWTLTHRYLGFDGDAKLYAVQALARLHPALTRDLFLQNVSQDNFTIFSAFYAFCIELLGLRYAELILTVVFKLWFMTAAWSLVRVFSNLYVAFLATASLIVVTSGYGAFHVFQYSEDWLTARSLGEALVITSLALHFRGHRVLSSLTAVVAMFVHPLMALPGVALLICVRIPFRMALAGAAAGLLATLAIVAFASMLAPTTHLVTVMDPAWLELTRARSKFLFLELWSIDDWKLNIRPLVTLVICTLVAEDPRVRKLSKSALLVGAMGLAVALIASLAVPIAILIQGQAWRWIWVAAFTAVLLLIPTAAKLWHERHCGHVCAVLLLCGWTFNAVDGMGCVGFALVLWVARKRITTRVAHYLRWAASVLGAVIALWAVANCWTVASSAQGVSGHDPHIVTVLRSVMGLDVMALLLVGGVIYWISTRRSALAPAMLFVSLLSGSAFVLPGAFRDTGQSDGNAGTGEFSDWRQAIPPTSNVFVIPTPVSAAFAWFVLERPNYLSVDQSSGIVFSRETAMEVRRRADVVLPVWDTNWQPETIGRTPKNGAGKGALSSPRPLTRDILLDICRDPLLNFVVAKENVGFDPIRHAPKGNWNNWNLYDCRHVTLDVPPA